MQKCCRSLVTRLFPAALVLFAALAPQSGRPAQPRGVPAPLAHHPGNIFLAGEEVILSLPRQPVGPWSLSDYDGRRLAEVPPVDGPVKLGALPVGFYWLSPVNGASNLWVSLGVLAPLRVPTPRNSPVALDVATSWFYPAEKMDAVANLCALAGVNWVRDRLSWAEMERQRGQFASSNRYDAAAWMQSRAGLRVLQVTHISPSWANPETKRFPLDLRDAYHFWQAMAKRWRGKVEAFEPWNEADIPMFGGHTGAEMAALQKAAFLGLKAGNPRVVACLNVFAVHNRAQLDDLHDNHAWPYFDTYNLHHYEPFDNYPRLYADHRSVSAGRPLWVSECAVPVKWAGDEKLKEPTEADLRVQAERVAKTFAGSFHEGSAATFYFLLPHYVEGQVQFGIVRPDLTPRPAYVALAAVGRMLAGARPLGRLESTNPAIRAFFFEARPDGRRRDVLVAWTTNREAQLTFPREPEAVYDHLGRPLTARTVELASAPVFAVFRTGMARRLDLSPPPQPVPVEKGKPSPIVFQALWPAAKTDLKQSAYRIVSDQAEEIPVYLYNFSDRPAKGTLRVDAPAGWKVEFPATMELAPFERKELKLAVDARGSAAQRVEKLRVLGEFKSAGRPVLSLRLLPSAAKAGPKSAQALPEADAPKGGQGPSSLFVMSERALVFEN